MRLEELTKSKIQKTTNSNLYVLRLRFLQLFAKYMGFEKREPLLKVEWDIFFKRYKILSREFETRELKYNKRGIDKELAKTKKFFIKILKESLLVNIDNDSFLIDPALHKKDLDSDIDYVIVTKRDNNCDILKEYENFPIYSMGKILDKLEVLNKHLFMKPLQITKNESVIIPIKISKDLMGLRITKGDIKVSILPELSPLTKKAGDLIANTAWITKVNDYENDGVTGELSFVELMKLADELNPTKIYLVNLSKNVLTHKEKIDEALKKWSGQILEAGETLSEDSFRISKPETTENYHHIPIRDSKFFVADSLRTIVLSEKDKIKAVIGKLKSNPTGSTEIQKYLFDADKWTMATAKKWIEEHKVEEKTEKAELYNLECIECGYKMTTEQHGQGLKCPKCGGQMRRTDRPGVGRDSKEESTMGSGKEKPAETQETEKAEEFECTCVECGYKMRSVVHCVNIKCPKCGAQMRRSSRPGSGKPEEHLNKSEINFNFQKINKKEYIVGGVIYHANVKDAQGDGADAVEIWKALKKYMIEKKNIKVMHKGASRNVPIIENYFVEEEHHKGGTDEKNLLKKGDWYLSVFLGDKENKDIWADVESKKLNGFSMAGFAQSD